jgi:hypothetical protein
MRKSTVYFVVVLTLLSLGLTLVPRAFSQTQDIKIVSYSYYIDSWGDLDVVGEVQNEGPNTVNSVILTGSVYNTNKVDQADSNCPVWVLDLIPQQEAPFYMEFPQPSSSPDGTWRSVDISRIDLTVAEANPTSSYQYPDLKITSSKASISTNAGLEGAYVVNGIIQNTGSQTAQNVTVVGAFYNSTGTVVAVSYTNYLAPASLPPSGTVSFQIAALDLNQTQVPSSEKITSYLLLVQTELPILQGTAPIVTPSPESSSSPSPSSSSSPSITSSSSATPLKTVNSNSSMNAAAIYAIGIVIAILAIAGAILAFRKSKPHETVKAKKNARKKSMVKILPQAFF